MGGACLSSDPLAPSDQPTPSDPPAPSDQLTPSDPPTTQPANQAAVIGGAVGGGLLLISLIGGIVLVTYIR